MDYENPTKMSEVMRYYGYEDVREYPQPYEKRAYMTNKIDLATNGYAKWLSERHDLIAGVQPDPDYSFPGGDRVNLTTQNQMCGGKNSQFHRYGAEFPLNNCHSWREDFTLCSVLDVFYDRSDKKAKAFVKKYVEENDNHMTGKYKGTGDFLELLSCKVHIF